MRYLLIACLFILGLALSCFAVPAPKKAKAGPREIDFKPLVGAGPFTMHLSFQFANGTKIKDVQVESDGLDDDARSLIAHLKTSFMQINLAADGNNKIIIKDLDGSAVVDVQANVIGFPKEKQPIIRVVEKKK